ncbi:unnamed protein product [Sphenostylis stenocarpa]|uniref:ZF-HD dimerization-type domain-containing protein n=1 Tax=Sphenostylis stenocarpa TaxID=92480 RepID=A0AA86T791_9FABA|nr:unnamed protein product [Sphenostylis stenocarpa]
MCDHGSSLFKVKYMMLLSQFFTLIWRWWRLLMPSCVCITHGLSEQSRPFNIKLVYGLSILLPPPNSPSNNMKLGVNVNYTYQDLCREGDVLFNSSKGEIPSFTRNDLKQEKLKESGVFWKEEKGGHSCMNVGNGLISIRILGELSILDDNSRVVVLKRDVANTSSSVITNVRYGECQKNHAANIGGYAVDGCREFMASTGDGGGGALTCAACGCHRNFHRREVQTEVVCEYSPPNSAR